MKKTKKEWIEFFNSIPDNVEISLNFFVVGCEYKDKKLKKITIDF